MTPSSSPHRRSGIAARYGGRYQARPADLNPRPALRLTPDSLRRGYWTCDPGQVPVAAARRRVRPRRHADVRHPAAGGHGPGRAAGGLPDRGSRAAGLGIARPAAGPAAERTLGALSRASPAPDPPGHRRRRRVRGRRGPGREQLRDHHRRAGRDHRGLRLRAPDGLGRHRRGPAGVRGQLVHLPRRHRRAFDLPAAAARAHRRPAPRADPAGRAGSRSSSRRPCSPGPGSCRPRSARSTSSASGPASPARSTTSSRTPSARSASRSRRPGRC